jgi:AraC-like DNA-binding protein
VTRAHRRRPRGRRDRRAQRRDARGSAGCIAWSDLVAASGIGRRQLERRFGDAVGIGPALLASIFRFRSVFDLIERDGSRPWTDAALAAGYYDQSHFIREFRRFVGCTAIGVRARERRAARRRWSRPPRLVANRPSARARLRYASSAHIPETDMTRLAIAALLFSTHALRAVAEGRFPRLDGRRTG